MESCTTSHPSRNVSSAFTQLFETGDVRTTDMFLVQSPMPITLICIGYLYFVLYLGPKLMKNRKPFSLKAIIALYNITQVVCNIILFISAVKLWVKYYGWGLSCLPVVPEGILIEDSLWGARVCHLYFLNKIADLVDTAFFVLKKKDGKISTLHVFHHAIMPLTTWFGVKFYPGGNLTFFALPNCFVHVWMYLYYFVAGLGPQYQKYVWWKRHLTEMQLIQFGIVGMYLGFVMYACNLHILVISYGILLNALFIFLFMNFYFKAYKKRNTEDEDSKSTIEKKTK